MCQSFEEVPDLFDMLTPANLQYVEGETSGSIDLVITVKCQGSVFRMLDDSWRHQRCPKPPFGKMLVQVLVMGLLS